MISQTGLTPIYCRKLLDASNPGQHGIVVKSHRGGLCTAMDFIQVMNVDNDDYYK